MTIDNCTCGRIMIGSEVTELRNWNPDCPEHGTDSTWYNSPEQVTRRAEQNTKHHVLSAKVKAARKLGHGCGTGEVLETIGECDVCDRARSILEEWGVK